MKKILIIVSLFAVSFATGFTCSKNAPEQAAQPEVATPTPPAENNMQEQMAVSSDTTTPTPATETETK